MSKKDFYKLLGVSKSSSQLEIKKAYKRLAMKYHPDRNKHKDAENKFKEIKEAYEILSDEKKRSAYDQYGHNAFEQSYTSNSFTYETNFGDIFGDVFGDMFDNNYDQNNNKGSDLKYNIELSLEESLKGIKKEIKFQTFVTCLYCNGKGIKKGYSTINCTTCNGDGQIQIRRGFFTLQQTCSKCNGKGKIIKNVCNICKGIGRIKKNKKLLIKIPSNLNNGDNIKISGEGEAGKYGSSSGDLYIHIIIKEHYIFKRKNNNLYCEVPIDFFTALLGGKIKVPTLNGYINLKIPSETQTGKLFKIKAKGTKFLNNTNKGDLIYKIIIETPINLNDNQKKFFNNLNKLININKNMPKSKKFFENIKKFLNNIKLK
ncbi:molecular chaperone DnaJ [Enterobacterales bacterium endosymbiont of Anomoneura mori]|uniref:molecular chaperone DnaJ n=1 Tax=Enterobacterales bacterium endosymbiont of Anomoneura mori TaxID=3132096 RepID=UPI00399C6ACF